MPHLVQRSANSYFVHNDDGTIREYDCFTCAHGNEIVVIQQGHEQGFEWDFCMKCMKPICLKCARIMAGKGGECEAFEKRLLRMERFGNFPPGAMKIDRDIARLIGTR